MHLLKKENMGSSSSRRVEGAGKRLMLISLTVYGSPGPIRFIVKEKDLVSNVIGTALKIYARQGRLPVLSSSVDDFLLYCPSSTTFEGLGLSQNIGSLGFRNFMLCKKPATMEEKVEIDKVTPMAATNKSCGILKNWFIIKALKHKLNFSSLES